MSTTIESLEVQIQSSSTSAVSGIQALTTTLERLRNAVQGGAGLTAVTNQLNSLNTALSRLNGANLSNLTGLGTTLQTLGSSLNGVTIPNNISARLTSLNTALNDINSSSIANLNSLTTALQGLSSVGNISISASIATRITSIGDAVRSLNGTNFSVLTDLANALTPLSQIGNINLGGIISQLQSLPQAMSALQSVNMRRLRTQLRQLANALTPLTQLGRSNLGSFVNQIQRLPQVMSTLQSLNIGTLATQIQQLANAFAPLATQMQSIANGFSSLPPNIQQLITSTNNLNNANNTASIGFANLYAKIMMVKSAISTFMRVVGSWITASSDYVEDLNLFNISMGQYAKEARAYAETVSEVMGIDVGEWMRNQGTFMTLATGFGIVSDRAYTMSQNLTQLGYDIASFYNISFSDAMLKLQSGISGEVKPLRRLGFDISVARLQQEAYTLGIEKNVTAMTQAEKAELRYYSIMTQIPTVQGDMARTLNAPANQLRILKAQVTQCARALGNIFIPALNKILPYAIAAVKAIRMVADSIAELVGFTLPEVDWSGLNSASSAISDIVDGTENADESLSSATDQAKELKNALLGIDELNIISPPETDTGSDDDKSDDSSLGSGFDFELPTYNFLAEAANSKVEEILNKWKKSIQEIIDKFKKWSGLTEDITTWGDFFHTKLGRILILVGEIGAGLVLWKLSNSFITNFFKLKSFLNSISSTGTAFKVATGITLAITGIAIETTGIISAIQEGLDSLNFAEIVGGGSVLTLGGITIGKAFGSAVIGGGIAAIVTGIPAFITGIYDSVVNGIDWLSASLTAIGITAVGGGIGAIIGACGGPIGAGIGALIGLITGAVVNLGIWLYQNWETVKVWLLGVWEQIKNFFTSTVSGWWNGTVVPFLQAIPECFIKILDTIGQWFSSLPGKIGYALGYAFGAIVQWAVNTYETLKIKIPEIVNAVALWFSTIPGKIYNAIILVKDKIVTWATNVIETIKIEVPKIINELVGFFKKIPDKLWKLGTDILNGLINGIKDAWKKLKDGVSDFCDGFVQGFKDALGINSPSKEFMSIGEYSADGLVEGVQNKFNDTKATITTWADKISEWFTENGVNANNFSSYASDIINSFKNKIGNSYTTTKNKITIWAAEVKNWFKTTASSTDFSKFATNIIDGFKNRVGNYYSTAKSVMNTFGSSIKNWFTDNVSYDKFYDVASDVVNGFSNGIGNLYNTCVDSISSWGSSVIDWFEETLDINSPSKVFYELGGYTIAGFNNAIMKEGLSTQQIVGDWANSFTSIKPSMKLAVDTSSLKYYNSESFAKSVSANVSSSSNITATGFKEAMEEFYKEYLESTMTQMSEDVRRQADKNEQTVVQIGTRTVSDAVTSQRKANGYSFVKT